MQAELSLYDHTVIAIQGFVMGVVLSHVFCDKHSPLTPLQVWSAPNNTMLQVFGIRSPSANERTLDKHEPHADVLARKHLYFQMKSKLYTSHSSKTDITV